VHPGFFVDNNDMKKRRVILSVIFSACFLATVCTAAQTAPGDEPISLNIQERPLGEVLAMITKITGHTFIIDNQWLDMPVSLSVEAIPLHKALKLIFSDINNAIIYQSNGIIKIIIYSETAGPNKGSGSQSTESPSPPEESESAAAAEQETETSQEVAPEDETDRSADGVEEGAAQPAEEQEPAEEQTENSAGGTAEKQGESTEAVTE